VLEQKNFPPTMIEETLARIVQCAQRLIGKNSGTIEGIGITYPAWWIRKLETICAAFGWRNDPSPKR